MKSITNRIAVLMTATAVISLFSAPSLACSAFLLKGHGYQVVGFNENWKHLPGMAVVNKRGIQKSNLSWAGMVAAHPQVSRLTWTTKYGSVTFNAFGIDMPCYGMNERGLFLVELFLDKTYSQPDPARPSMFWAQWIQFQLDNFASVDELVQHLPEAPVIDWWPQFPGSHFFATDASGRTASIEFIDGKPVVSTAEKMPQPILCNGPYQQELAALAQFKGFGGEQSFIEPKNNWNVRFATIAHRLKDYRPEMGAPQEFAWKLLDRLSVGTWQLVADVESRTLYFRSKACGTIKSIRLSDCDFSRNSAIRYIDLHANFKGNVVPQLAAWTPEINQAYVLAGFPAGYEQESFYRSEDYQYLQRNLKHYGVQLQRQVKTSHSRGTEHQGSPR
jgi:penicillin V acylase-like amidase (Ntn superfamily)